MKLEQISVSNVGLLSGREKKKRDIGMARKRAENRKGSLGFPGKRLVLSLVLHENGGASCSIGEGVIVHSTGRKPMAHMLQVTRGTILSSTLQ
ncbi:hypothetical protein TNCV_3080571 [Trichonephila clavipes]|nr:hypothetical protein TNCV_3080571 [Trichonephila clavipes]